MMMVMGQESHGRHYSRTKQLSLQLLSLEYYPDRLCQHGRTQYSATLPEGDEIILGLGNSMLLCCHAAERYIRQSNYMGNGRQAQP